MDRTQAAPVEPLEPRRLMAAVLDGRVLSITGLADAENAIAVGFKRGQVHTVVNGERKSFSLAGLKQIRITGGELADVVKVDPSVIIPVRVRTFGGNDCVTAGSSNDIIETGDGNDLVYAGPGNDAVNGGNGDDRVYGQDGNDSLNGGGGADKLSGNGGRNVFLKVETIDRVYGRGLDTVTFAKVERPAATSGGPKPSTPSNVPASNTTAPRPVAVIKAIARTVPAGTSVHVDAVSSTLKGGTWNEGSYAWDFGDPAGAHNTMRGFNAAHVYDTPGVYAVSLTVTNAAGKTDTATLEFTVTASGRRTIYVAADGSDASDGRSPSRPVKSIAKALTLVENDTEVLFRRGDTFAQTASFRIDRSNVLVGAYGSGKQPKIVWSGTRTNDVMFHVNVGTQNVTVQDLSIDTIFDQDTADSGTPLAFKPGGTNFTARRNTLLNLQYGVLLNANPTGVNVQDNVAPLATGLRKYFVWVQGDHITIAGNTAANSTREHIVRANFARLLNVSGNDFTNLSRREAGDYWDIRKTAVNVQSGEFAYVYGNRIDGSFQVGPLGQKDGKTGAMSASMRFKFVVGESNEIVDDQIVVNHGAEHVTLRDNTIKNDGLLAINVDGYNADYHRGVVDLVIRNNTAVNSAASGSFLRVYGAVDGIQLLNNLYVAPNLAIGAKLTAVVKLEPDALASFTKIDGNVWPLARSTAKWVGEPGINYVGTGYTASGFYTADEWNALKPVGTDVFRTVTAQQAGTFVLNGMRIGARKAA